MAESRQEYWSGLPCPPGDFPNPGIKPASLKSTCIDKLVTTSTTWEASVRGMHFCYTYYIQQSKETLIMDDMIGRL